MFYITEERELMRNIAREFAEKEVKPCVSDMEKDIAMPKVLFKRMGELGFSGLGYSEEYNGIGPDYVALGLVVEEISKVSPATAFTWSVSASSVADLLKKMGSQDQIEKWLKPNVEGDLVFAVSSCEPCGVANYPEYQTSAVLEGDEWVINGFKNMTTNTANADLFFTICVTSPVDIGKMHGLSLIAIPANSPGIEIAPAENKVGMHGCSTGGIKFKNVRVPKENVVGPVGEYLTAGAGVQLPVSFSLYGALCLGGATACYEKALTYTKMKAQYGNTLFDSYQIIKETLGKMRVELDIFRAAVYTCLEMLNKGEDVYAQAIGLKIKGPQLMASIARESVILQGCNGVVVDTGIERFYRDALVLDVGGGSTHAMYDALAIAL